MGTTASSPDAYIAALPADRQSSVKNLHKVIRDNLDGKFESGIAYGMISYHVPLSLHPPGYHSKPGTPVPFMSLASQKNHVVVHHMGLYMKDLLAWFSAENGELCGKQPDMGKCCIRFRIREDIP